MEDSKKVDEEIEKAKAEKMELANKARQARSFILEKNNFGAVTPCMQKLPSEILLNICSFLDISSLLKLEQANKPIHNTVEFHISKKHEKCLVYAQREFFALHGRLPCKLTPNSKPSDTDPERFHLRQLQKFHHIIKSILKIVNKVKGTSDLNIISGEDLLYSVGRLSMMINSADFFPVDEVRPLPLNWTSEKFFKIREEEMEDYDAEKVLENLKTATPSLLFPSYVEAYKKQETNRKLIVESAEPILSWLSKVISFLDHESIRKLALTNKTFLILIRFAPPPDLSNDKRHEEAIVRLAILAAKLFKSRKVKLPQEFLFPFEKLLLTNKPKNKILHNILPKILNALNEVKSDQYSMGLPWGGNKTVELVQAGSVRLIFSEAVEIMQLIDDKSEAIDLSYERIVKYLSSLSNEDIEKNIKETFMDLSKARNAFIGELLILLVGIEGSQNNFTLLHAPMCVDLIRSGKLTWKQVLFEGHNGIPYFVMAGDKSEKPRSVMERHSDILKKGKFEDDGNDGYDKLEKFIRREFELHDLFFDTYFPQLQTYTLEDQLDMSALFVKNYLIDVFFNTKNENIIKMINEELIKNPECTDKN